MVEIKEEKKEEVAHMKRKKCEERMNSRLREAMIEKMERIEK